MNNIEKICFLASRAKKSQMSLNRLINRFGTTKASNADVIVALGGDGFMLQTLRRTQDFKRPVYGMNRGSIGFLMNEYSEDNIRERLSKAEMEVIHPLRMVAQDMYGNEHTALAINEISLFRSGPQAIKLQIFVDGQPRLDELMCDGALLATPAGSTAYNYSAHGPILPLGSNVLALTAIAAFRPRRWRGALIPETFEVRFVVLETDKRPCMANADGIAAKDVVEVRVRSDRSISHTLLFDHGHGLQERLLREQFV